jgi:hypothetical protein
MKIIAVERELRSVPLDEAAAVYRAEAAHVYALYTADAVREIYLTEERCAVLVLECESIEQAKEILAGFPLVKGGFIAFDVHELRPYRGYGRLMRE